jgi:hypothetical protein
MFAAIAKLPSARHGGSTPISQVAFVTLETEPLFLLVYFLFTDPGPLIVVK